MSKQTTLPKISSFAAPTEEDIAIFEALTDDEKRRLIEAEIEKSFSSKTRKVTAKDIVAAVEARRKNG